MAAIAPFQQAYLGACLTRMSDAATAAFPGGSRALPTSAELQKFIGYVLSSFTCSPIFCHSCSRLCCVQIRRLCFEGEAPRRLWLLHSSQAQDLAASEASARGEACIQEGCKGQFMPHGGVLCAGGCTRSSRARAAAPGWHHRWPHASARLCNCWPRRRNTWPLQVMLLFC